MFNVALGVFVAENNKAKTAVIGQYKIRVISAFYIGGILIRRSDGSGAEITANVRKTYTLCVNLLFFALAVNDSSADLRHFDIRNLNALAVYEDLPLVIRRARCQMYDCKNCRQRRKNGYDCN